MWRADTGADTRADIFLPRPPQQLISPWRKKGNICETIVKNKESGRIVTYFLPDSNQYRTENTVKTLKYPFSYTEYLYTKWRQRQTFERHNVTTVINARNVFAKGQTKCL